MSGYAGGIWLTSDLSGRHPSTAIDLLASNPALLEQLRKAHMGNYQLVLSLLSSLDHGRQMKRVVDAIIDNCESVARRLANDQVTRWSTYERMS
jgi:hypothetical protein